MDYVVKPARAAEVLARLATHVRNARAVRLAREAVDVGGLGVLVVDARGRVAWRSPQAQRWLQDAGAEADATAWLQGDLAPSCRCPMAAAWWRAAWRGGLGETRCCSRPPAPSDDAAAEGPPAASPWPPSRRARKRC